MSIKSIEHSHFDCKSSANAITIRVNNNRNAQNEAYFGATTCSVHDRPTRGDKAGCKSDDDDKLEDIDPDREWIWRWFRCIEYIVLFPFSTGSFTEWSNVGTTISESKSWWIRLINRPNLRTLNVQCAHLIRCAIFRINHCADNGIHPFRWMHKFLPFHHGQNVGHWSYYLDVQRIRIYHYTGFQWFLRSIVHSTPFDFGHSNSANGWRGILFLDHCQVPWWKIKRWNLHMIWTLSHFRTSFRDERQEQNEWQSI